VTQLLAAGKMTAPSSMAEEKAANPFLRADVPEIAKAIGMAGAPAAEVFAEIRTRKNKF
jgi:hydroxyacylglutathione hydrolase